VDLQRLPVLGLDATEQARSGFGYEYSVYQVEYSRNLLFKVGGQMDRVFNTLVDRTRSRLDVPTLRTLFGAKQRPRRDGSPELSPRLAVVIETPRWDLTWFKVHFGLLSLKAYTKGEHVLRVEATVHNTRQLGCGRALGKFPQIVTRLAGMTQRFCTTLDCITTGYLPDGTLDQLPLPSRIGRTRIGGIDLNKPRIRAALAAVLALAVAPGGFTVADLAAKVQPMTGQTQTGYTIRQAAYDLRKLRGKELLVKPGRSRRYQVPAHRPPAPSRPCWPCAIRSSAPSWPVSAAPGWAASPPTGPPSTATTRPCASACRPSSPTSASPPAPRHRQQFVDPHSASA
jgi:hypothetical protein